MLSVSLLLVLAVEAAKSAGIDVSDIIVPIVTAIIAATAAIAVAWRRLSVLGASEKGKLEAEKEDIIQTAEDRATARALEALKLALDVTERERDRAHREADAARKELEVARREIAEMRARLTQLEDIVERRRIDSISKTPNPLRRKTDLTDD